MFFLVTGFLFYLFTKEDYSPSSNTGGSSGNQFINSFVHALTSNGEPRRVHLKDLSKGDVAHLSDWDRAIHRFLNKYNMYEFQVKRLSNEDLEVLVAIPQRQGEPLENVVVRQIATNLLKERASISDLTES